MSDEEKRRALAAMIDHHRKQHGKIVGAALADVLAFSEKMELAIGDLSSAEALEATRVYALQIFRGME
jgi:hypothetical protein